MRHQRFTSYVTFYVFVISVFATTIFVTNSFAETKEYSPTSSHSGWLKKYQDYIQTKIKIKFCVVNSTHTARRIHKICPKLNDTESQVKCVIGNDRSHCLQLVTAHEADFTILEAEDLLVTVPYKEWDILVTNELRALPDEKQHFGMVVLAHKDINYLWQLRGKGLCHPGFTDVNDPDFTKAFSQYLEEFLIVTECDQTKTLLEDRIMGLSKYFEKACIAGPWSLNLTYDHELKLKYDNLCALCADSESCYVNDNYYGQEGALQCLTNNVGDVAWVRLDHVQRHFKEEPQDKKDDYKFICPDGTSRRMDNPCIWITKPWPVIVSRREQAASVSKTVTNLKDSKYHWQDYVLELMENYHPIPVETENLEMPEDFLKQFPGFLSANNRAPPCQPSRRVKWCVSSNLENRKCQRLRDISSAYGIQPQVACIRVPHGSSCLELVRNRRADIYVAKPQELLAARKNGLKSIIHATSNKKKDLDRIAIVVRQDSRFEKLMNLEEDKACFTGYRSVGWNAFLYTMRNQLKKVQECSDALAIGNFFHDSCVVGAANINDNDMPSNLYSTCAKDALESETSTFHCLTSRRGNVAFVNLKSIENTEEFKGKKYKTLCVNDTNAEESQECWLTWTPLAYIVAHENITDLRTKEIRLMLLEMNKLFGNSFQSQTPAFTLYGQYDGNHSIIFPELTQQLKTYVRNNKMEQGWNYEEIVENLVKPYPCNIASSLQIFNGNSCLLLIISFFSRRILRL